MSLTSDDLADIKQLMEATIGVALKEQDKRLEKRFEVIDRRFDEQDEKLDTILDAVGVRFEEHEAQLSNHDTRITKLERRAA